MRVTTTIFAAIVALGGLGGTAAAQTQGWGGVWQMNPGAFSLDNHAVVQGHDRFMGEQRAWVQGERLSLELRMNHLARDAWHHPAVPPSMRHLGDDFPWPTWFWSDW